MASVCTAGSALPPVSLVRETHSGSAPARFETFYQRYFDTVFLKFLLSIFLKLLTSVFSFIFERERERASTYVEGAEGEGERIPSRLHIISVEPDVGLKLTNRESRSQTLRESKSDA